MTCPRKLKDNVLLLDNMVFGGGGKKKETNVLGGEFFCGLSLA